MKTMMIFGEHMKKKSGLTSTLTSDQSHHHDAASGSGLFLGPGHALQVCPTCLAVTGDWLPADCPVPLSSRPLKEQLTLSNGLFAKFQNKFNLYFQPNKFLSWICEFMAEQK